MLFLMAYVGPTPGDIYDQPEKPTTRHQVENRDQNREKTLFDINTIH